MFSSCALQEHFSSAQLDSEPGGDAEELGKAMEELLDDALERVDTSLDRARALLKAPANTSAPAAEAGPVLAAQPVAGAEALLYAVVTSALGAGTKSCTSVTMDSLGASRLGMHNLLGLRRREVLLRHTWRASSHVALCWQ